MISLLAIVIVSILIVSVVTFYFKTRLDYNKRIKLNLISSRHTRLFSDINILFFVIFTLAALSSIIYFVIEDFVNGWFLFALAYAAQLLLLFQYYTSSKTFVQLIDENVIIHSAFNSQKLIHISDLKSYDSSSGNITLFHNAHQIAIFSIINVKENSNIISIFCESIIKDNTSKDDSLLQHNENDDEFFKKEKIEIFEELGKRRAKERIVQIFLGLIKFIAFVAFYIGLIYVLGTYLKASMAVLYLIIFGFLAFGISLIKLVINPIKTTINEKKLDLITTGVTFGAFDSKVKGGNKLRFEKSCQKYRKFVIVSTYLTVGIGLFITLVSRDIITMPTYKDTIEIKGTIQSYTENYSMFSTKSFYVKLNEYSQTFLLNRLHYKDYSSFYAKPGDTATLYVEEDSYNNSDQNETYNYVSFTYLKINDFEIINMNALLYDYWDEMYEIYAFLGVTLIPTIYALVCLPVSYLIYKTREKSEDIDLPLID